MPGSTEAPGGRPADGPGPALLPLARAGLNVVGVISASDYDALVPEGWRTARHIAGARAALVIGSGGGDLARAALDAGGPDPVDRATVAAVGACVDALVAAGEAAGALHGFERRSASGAVDGADAGFADFVALGVAAGLGVPSRLRILVHPVYGPWLAIRSVVLTTARLAPSTPLSDFAPCDGCPAPCQAACPADALAAGPLDWNRCSRERLSGGPCALHCAARQACVVGSEHAHTRDIEAHFMRSSLGIASESFASPSVR